MQNSWAHWFLLSAALLTVQHTAASSNNEIEKPEASGKDVVEATVDRIASECIFSDDKWLLRRIAYVETTDGKAPDTFPPDYHGGIWKMDEDMFNVTQSSAFKSAMANYITEVKNELQVDWNTVSWSDLRKPLHCALGAMFYIQYVAKVEIPRSIDDQATFWKTYYRPSGDVQHFIDSANRLENVDNCKGADSIFILDSSGSIGDVNWKKELDFVVQVVQSMNIGADANRVGIIVYSSSATYSIKLNDYFDKSQLCAAISKLPFENGGTSTYLALDLLATEGFTIQNGGRPTTEGNPRVSFLLSDGMSSSMSATIAAADRAKEQGIVMYTVGVGTGVRVEELKAVASDPKCLQYFQLDAGFNEIDALVSSIARKACDAPLVLDPEGGTEIEKPMEPGEDIDCTIKVPNEGITVKITAKTGSVAYYLARDTYPSSAYYEYVTEAQEGEQAVVFVPSSGSQVLRHKRSTGEKETVFCNIKANETTGSNVTIDTDVGKPDWCASGPCLNQGVCIDKVSKYECKCTFYWTGDHCEEAATFNCQERNPCARENTLQYGYYFPHEEKTKFVQCNDHEYCWEMSCSPGTEWDDAIKTCNYPK